MTDESERPPVRTRLIDRTLTPFRRDLLAGKWWELSIIYILIVRAVRRFRRQPRRRASERGAAVIPPEHEQDSERH